MGWSWKLGLPNQGGARVMSTTPAPEHLPQEHPEEQDPMADVPMRALLDACKAAAAVSTPPEREQEHENEAA